MNRVASFIKTFASRTANEAASAGALPGRALVVSRASPSASIQTLSRGSGIPSTSPLVTSSSTSTSNLFEHASLLPSPTARSTLTLNNTTTHTKTSPYAQTMPSSPSGSRKASSPLSAAVTKFSGPAFTRPEECPVKARATQVKRKLELSLAAESDNTRSNDAPAASGFSNLSVATFNVLAPCYKGVANGDLESNHPELFTRRHTAIAQFIKSMGPLDVLCLQEFWFNKDVQNIYKDTLEGSHQLFPFKRPFYKQDGLMIAVAKHITVKDSRYITFEDRGLRCAILLHVQIPGPTEDAAPVDCIIANTHLTFPHDDHDERVRCKQGKYLRETLTRYSIERCGNPDMATIVMGDFNGVADTQLSVDYKENGFHSSFAKVNSREAEVSHRSHRGDEVGVDFVWMNNPEVLQPQRALVLPTGMCDKAWPKDFDLSDHRPVYVEYLVAHQAKDEECELEAQ